MSMYLPNPDLQPTGDEPVEFLEIPRMADDTTEAGTSVEQGEGLDTHNSVTEAASAKGPELR